MFLNYRSHLSFKVYEHFSLSMLLTGVWWNCVLDKMKIVYFIYFTHCTCRKNVGNTVQFLIYVNVFIVFLSNMSFSCLEIGLIHPATKEDLDTGQYKFEVYALPHTCKAHCIIPIVCYVLMRAMTYYLIFNSNPAECRS